MKKLSIIFIIGILLLSLVGCGKDSTDNSTANSNEEQASADGSSQANSSTEWPEEFSKWDVPTIANATVTAADNKSITASGGITQGVNAIVNLKNLSKSDFDEYIKALEKSGFEKNANESLADVMLIYEKSVSGGIIKITLMYNEETTTITVNNSAAAAEKDAAAGGSVNWPESLKGIPEFTKGSYVETVEMGGGMYAINFKDVTEADLDSYRKALKSAGFEQQTDSDTEGYAKFDTDKAYSVGFFLEGSNLQIIAISSSY